MLKLAVLALVISAATCSNPIGTGNFQYAVSGECTTGLTGTSIISEYDYVSTWLNPPQSGSSNTDWNPYWTGVQFSNAKSAGKGMVFYGYIIAFQARADSGIQDCNVNPGWSLCNQGANYIRNNRAKLVSRYSSQGASVAAAGGKSMSIYVLMEPDFWQYYAPNGSGGETQVGGPISGSYAAQLWSDFVNAFKAQVPNAKFSFDISSWPTESQWTTWWGFFKGNSEISFVNTSGGQSLANNVGIQAGQLQWSWIHHLTGKKIIADCGIGAGGGATNNCQQWSGANLAARIKDGVVALVVGSGGVYNPPALTRSAI